LDQLLRIVPDTVFEDDLHTLAALIFAAGFPFSTIKSACLPTASEPTRASTPRNFAPLRVAILIASSGVKPASTGSSTVRTPIYSTRAQVAEGDRIA
jgi:hypothetical protein